MADSAIAITGLAVSGGVSQNIIRLTASLGSCLPYLALDKFEIWSASSNNRALATKVGETADVNWTHTGLLIGTTRYYWARARDLSGNLGDFYPLSATAGVAGTTVSTGANSVGSTELQPNSVGNTHIQASSVSTSKLQAGAVTADKMQVTSLEAISATLGNVAVNGNLVINGTLSSPKYGDLSILTQKLANNAVTVSAAAIPPNNTQITGAGYANQNWVTITSLVISPQGGATLVFANALLGCSQFHVDSFGGCEARLLRDGGVALTVPSFYDDFEDGSNKYFPLSALPMMYLDEADQATPHTYTLQARNTNPIDGLYLHAARGSGIMALNLRK